MSTDNADVDPTGTIQAAEIAVGKDELDTAENALLKALSEVRRRKARGGDDE